MAKIAKAYEMTNAEITFVSLVDKAANKKQFLITKSDDDGKATFQTYGRILKSDPDAHYVTGIVYEPMAEDTQGNFMTEDEITKAAHWFAKNGNQVDLQHSFKPLDGATVVESSVAKCDYELDGEMIKKGTWVMTVEITDQDIFDAIEKGEITGFSMGGKGQYSLEDVQLEDSTVQKKSIFKSLAKLMGFDVVEKGAVKDNYDNRIKSENFWQAYCSLQDALFRWDYYEDCRVYEGDPDKIQEALTDFNEIVTELLSSNNVEKSVKSICKAGKKLSSANKETLKGIHESLGEFLSKFEEEEEVEVTREELTEVVKSAISEYAGTNPVSKKTSEPENITKEDILEVVKQTLAGGVTKQQEQPKEEEKITKSDVQEMIDAAIRKATGEEVEAPVESGVSNLSEAITKAVSEALEPLLKQSGVPSNLNDNIIKGKEEEHYMHGFI